MKNKNIEPQMFGRTLFRIMAYVSLVLVIYWFLSSLYFNIYIGGLYALFILGMVSLVIETIINLLDVRKKGKYRGEVVV